MGRRRGAVVAGWLAVAAGGLAAAVSDDKIVVAELIPMMSYFSSLPTTMYYHLIHNTVDNSFFIPQKILTLSSRFGYF